VRPAVEGGDRILALLDQLVDHADDGGVIQHDALVHLTLLDGSHQQADGAQARAVLGAHGRLHVVGDLVFQGHAGLGQWQGVGE
jgi:hypothetical protein